MDNNYLVNAIKKLRPMAEFSFQNNDYATIKWDFLEGKAPTQTEINNAIEEIKSAESAAGLQTATDKAALLTKLGITAAEAELLLN